MLTRLRPGRTTTRPASTSASPCPKPPHPPTSTTSRTPSAHRRRRRQKAARPYMDVGLILCLGQGNPFVPRHACESPVGTLRHLAHKLAQASRFAHDSAQGHLRRAGRTGRGLWSAGCLPSLVRAGFSSIPALREGAHLAVEAGISAESVTAILLTTTSPRPQTSTPVDRADLPDRRICAGASIASALAAATLPKGSGRLAT